MSTSRLEGVSRVKTETFEYHMDLKDFENQLKVIKTYPETFTFAGLSGFAEEDKEFSLNLSFREFCEFPYDFNSLIADVVLNANFENVTVFLTLGFLFDNGVKDGRIRQPAGKEGKYSGKVMLPYEQLWESGRFKYCQKINIASSHTISSGILLNKSNGYTTPTTNFVNKMDLINCNFLRENALRIVCEVQFRKVFIDYNICPQLNLAEEEYSFVDLLESGDMSDITVVCGEKTFSCHSAILGGKSPVFKAMLNNSCLEKETRQIVIEGMEAKTLEVLLTYCYGGKPSGDFGDDTVNVFLAADQYDIQPLKRRCEKLLVEKEDSLSVDSCLKLLAIADLHSADLLMSAGMRFLAKNTKEVMDLPTWDQFLTDHPHLVNRIMREISRR